MSWFLSLAATSGVLFTVGDIFLKIWAEQSGAYIFGTAIATYLAATICLGYTFQYDKFAIVVTILVCFNLLSATLIGYFFFNEPLVLRELGGIALTVVALFLLSS